MHRANSASFGRRANSASFGRRRALAGALLAWLVVGQLAAQPVPVGGPAGLVALAPGAGAGGISSPGTGALPSAVLDLNFIDGSTFDSRITYTGSNGTFFNSAGALTAATTNVPRYDFDPVTLAARGWLIEEARTNRVLASAVLATQSVTVTAAATTLSFYGTGSVALSGTFVGNLAGTGAFPTRVSLTFTPTAGSLTLTVTGSVLNAQVETGGFATSYIPTVGATVTRTADLATMTVNSTWFNAAASSVVADWSLANAPPAGTQAGIVRLDDATDNNRILLFVNLSGIAGFSASSGAGVQLSTTFSSGLSTLREGGTFNGALWAACLSGGTVTSGAGIAPVGLTRLIFGSTSGASTWILNGYLRRVRIWPRAVASAELQQATR